MSITILLASTLLLPIGDFMAKDNLSAQGESVYAKVAESVFLLRVTNDAGSDVANATGFVVGADTLLTNAHVVTAGHVSVQVGPLSLPCEVQRIDSVNDLAICQIHATVSVTALKLASDDPKPGSTIYAIGNPRGLEKTISQGLFTGYRDLDGRRVTQVSAAISPGSSGGPIVNPEGEVVGVTVASLTNGQNLNFAVPLAVVRQFLANKAVTSSSPAQLELVRRLAKERDGAVFSTETDSVWQRTDREFINQFRMALAATDDVVFVQQLHDIAASDWHMELALAAAQKAIAIAKKPDRVLYSNLARALYFVNSATNQTLKDATKAAERAVELGLAKNADDLLLLGDIYSGREENQSAYATYRKAEFLIKPGTPEALQAYTSLFQTSRDLGRPAEADQWFGKAKKEPGILAFHWADYAAFLSKVDRDRESALAYIEAFRLAPSMYAYLCEAGKEYYLSDLMDDALRAERACIEEASAKPKSEATVQVSHRVIAAILNGRGVYDEAVLHAKQAIQLDSSDPWAHYELARALNSLQRFTEATTEAKASLRLSDGKYSEMHFELGSAYFGLKQWSEAQQAYQKAAELNPKGTSAAYNVAVSYYNGHYYSEALRWYQEVLRRNPNVDNRAEVQRMINSLSPR